MKIFGPIFGLALLAGCATVQPYPNEYSGPATAASSTPSQPAPTQTVAAKEPTYDVVAGGPRPDIGVAVGSHGAGVSVGWGGLSVGVGTGGRWGIGAWFRPLVLAMTVAALGLSACGADGPPIRPEPRTEKRPIVEPVGPQPGTGGSTDPILGNWRLCSRLTAA